jgi:hypothetical protein
VEILLFCHVLRDDVDVGSRLARSFVVFYPSLNEFAGKVEQLHIESFLATRHSHPGETRFLNPPIDPANHSSRFSFSLVK